MVFSATLGYGLWCLTPLSTIFQLDRGGHIMLYQVHLAMNGVIGTDCIGSCKSNYHKIMITTFSITPLYG
jgi:hypothetical protein